MTEAEKNEWAAMEKRLMPPSGKADTVAGEIIRAVDRIVYRWYNDGDKINVNHGKEFCNGSARYLEAYLGFKIPLLEYGKLPSEIWDGELDREGYTYFTDELLDGVFAYLKAHPELETTPNEYDSRADFEDEV